MNYKNENAAPPGSGGAAAEGAAGDRQHHTTVVFSSNPHGKRRGIRLKPEAVTSDEAQGDGPAPGGAPETPGPFAFSVADAHTSTHWSAAVYDLATLQARLTQAQPGPKEGTCYMPAKLAGNERKWEAVESISIMIHDVDNGSDLSDLPLEHLTWVVPTWSYGATETEISAAAWDRTAREHPELDDAGLLQKLKRIVPEVAEGAREVRREGKKVIIQHQPCPKFRIVRPLAAPFNLKGVVRTCPA